MEGFGFWRTTFIYFSVYGTYDRPVHGWVGNANSGHLGNTFYIIA